MSFSDTNLSDADAGTSPATKAADLQRENTFYQNGRPVAEALDVQVDSEAREIRFGEVYHSDDLLIPEDCEFREYRILIQKVAFASRQETGAAHKGRVLKGVVAEILGYRQQ